MLVGIQEELVTRSSFVGGIGLHVVLCPNFMDRCLADEIGTSGQDQVRNRVWKRLGNSGQAPTRIVDFWESSLMLRGIDLGENGMGLHWDSGASVPSVDEGMLVEFSSKNTPVVFDQIRLHQIFHQWVVAAQVQLGDHDSR